MEELLRLAPIDSDSLLLFFLLFLATAAGKDFGLLYGNRVPSFSNGKSWTSGNAI